MSEPNGELPPPPPNPPADPSATAEPAPLTVAPRANPTSVYNPKDAAAGPSPEAPAGFNEFVAWMQAFGGAQSPPPPTAPTAPATPGARPLLTKEQKKFHRQGQESARNDRSAAVSEPPPADAGDTPRGGPGATVTPPPPGTGPRTLPVIRKRRPQTVTQSPGLSLIFLIPWLLGGALLAGSFLLGRVTAPRPTPVSESAEDQRTAADRGVVNVQVLDVVDQAMMAEARHDFDHAASLLEQARHELNHIPGLDYHLGALALEKGDLPRAMSYLNRSIGEGEEMAAAYNLRGTMANRQAGINRGLPALQTATQLDPFNAKYFFFYGEALRRAGKPQAALEALQKAIYRLREPSLEGLYSLKMRLALIELGREKEFADELARELARPSPSIDWLCTAAAVEMRAGRFENAAFYMDKVLASPERQLLDVRLHDFFFYGYAHEKALAKFYPQGGPMPTATSVPSASTPGENALPPPATSPPDGVMPTPGPTPAAHP